MPKTKYDLEATTPKIEAQQTAWHVEQAADFFLRSINGRLTAQNREAARKRFLANTRAALPHLGLEKFLTDFRGELPQLENLWHRFRLAEPIIREIAAEPEPPRAQPVDNAALAARLIETALKLLSEKEAG